MSDSHYELAVVGLGAMGAAALYQAARRGAKVLGIDRFNPPHHFGSSHGDTRITRQAIGEGEMYMPFIQRANQIWRELEVISGRDLYLESGGLIVAPKQGAAQFHAHGDFVERSAGIARDYHIQHEILNAAEVRRRFPNIIVPDSDRAYYEPGAGVLRPELCIQTQLELASQAGACIHTGEIVLDYQPGKDAVRVVTDKGSYYADKLILSAGAWMPGLLPAEYRRGLQVYRQVIYWFEVEDLDVFYPENFPWLIWIGDMLEDFFSAFPIPRDGVLAMKLVTEQYSQTTHPQEVDRVVAPEEAAWMYHHLTAPRLKGLRDKLLHAQVCLYTVTPDDHFVIDWHPASERVILASPCSGHGFKHSSAVGECLMELALDGVSQFDVSAFNLARLSAF